MIASIRIRLTLSYLLSFGILLLGFSIAIYLLLLKHSYDQLDRSLLDAGKITANIFQNEIQENDDAIKAGIETINELKLPDIYLILFAEENLLASTFPNDHRVVIPFDLKTTAYTSEHEVFFTIMDFGEEGARIAILPLKIKEKKFLIVSLKPLHELVEEREALQLIFYLSFPSTLLIAGLGGFWLAKKSLSPVIAISQQAQNITAQNLHERLKVENEADEFGQLAALINDLLARLELAFGSMRQFMTDASHELRTPLAIIRGEADVTLLQEREPAQYRESLSIIQDEAKRLSRIVDDLLVLARADNEQNSLKMTEFYLNDLVEECYRAIQVLAKNKNITLTLATNVEDLTLYGDEDMVKRLILNLLDNAIKYTPQGGNIILELVRDAKNAQISVSDTGIGISTELVNAIFERFYRIDKARSRTEGGSGLGLSIAKWVVQAHQGTIEVTSKLGIGSKFTVTLPLMPKIERL